MGVEWIIKYKKCILMFSCTFSLSLSSSCKRIKNIIKQNKKICHQIQIMNCRHHHHHWTIIEKKCFTTKKWLIIDRFKCMYDRIKEKKQLIDWLIVCLSYHDITGRVSVILFFIFFCMSWILKNFFLNYFNIKSYAAIYVKNFSTWKFFFNYSIHYH